MINNEWLENETAALRRERIKKKQPPIFVWVLMLLCVSTAVLAYDRPVKSPVARWSATWFCPDCGYENMDGITHCGVCGCKRPKKR